MIPAEFTNFFIASAGAGAALVGLLFVAVSLAPEQIVTRGAPVERRAVAGSAFTALINAFFILALTRAWELLGAHRYGLGGWLNPLQDVHD